MRILAIETSCDDTCVAIIEVTPISGSKIPPFKILSNIVSSQTKIHRKYGGVVPALAKRAHAKNLVPVLEKALREADMFKIFNFQFSIFKQKLNDKLKTVQKILKREPELLENFLKTIAKIKKPKIDLIAVTHGPGLEPALWAGVNFARALSYWWNIPLLGVDHMEGHIAANFINKIGGNPKSEILNSKHRRNISFPALVLAVSGGHTQLILVKDIKKYKLLGETVDDAAGEGFDKAARLLGLRFPGGPEIQKQASAFLTHPPNPLLASPSRERSGSYSINLPRPMLHTKDYNFSFSGLKTAVLYDYKKRPPRVQKSKEYIQAMSYEFQQAAIDVLIAKTIRAAKEYNAKTIMLAGGVAANSELRKQLDQKIKKEIPHTIYNIPHTTLTTDNAAMIAAAAYFHKSRATLTRWKTLRANGNLKIS